MREALCTGLKNRAATFSHSDRSIGRKLASIDKEHDVHRNDEGKRQLSE
jgi:hypothetical protein